MTPDEIRSIVRDELASLGGRLLATHGPSTDTPNDVLATLGGYLLVEYGTTEETRDAT
jgi:hypothetical protein